MSNPIICTLMGNYNYSAYIEEAIRSIMNQDYPHLIIGVVDDGSSDNSPGIIERLAKEDSRIKPIYLKKGVGVAEARNLLIRKHWDDCHFFLIADSDDVLMKNKVSRLLSKMLISPYIVGAYGDYTIRNMSNPSYVLAEYKEPYDAVKLRQNCIVHSACMISKDGMKAVEEIVDGQPSYFDKELHCWRGDGQFAGSVEDWDAFIRLNEVGLFCHVGEFLTEVRVHNSNQSQIEKVSKTINKNMERINFKAQQRALKRQQNL